MGSNAWLQSILEDEIRDLLIGKNWKSTEKTTKTFGPIFRSFFKDKTVTQQTVKMSTTKTTE